MKENNNLNEFSILRAIGALSVITIHVTSTFGQFDNSSLSYLVFGIINKFCNFAVPLFLLLSVMLLIRNSLKSDNFNISNFYKRRFMKILPIYLAYIFVYYLILTIKGSSLINPINEPLKFFTSYILHGDIYYHLYFMPIIFQLYLFFPAIYWITKKAKKIKLPIILNFVLTFIALTLLQYVFQIIHKYYIWPHYQRPAILMITYALAIGIGAWLGANYEEFQKSKIIKILSLLIATISGYFFIRYTIFPTQTLHNLIFPIYTTSISIVLLQFATFLSNKTNLLKESLAKISTHSLHIYLIHPLILNLFKTYFSPINFTNIFLLNNIIFGIIQFAIIFTISYLIANVIYILKKRMSN